MIYFDNASTTFPKPKTVSEYMKYYIDGNGSSVKRGTSTASFEAGEIVYEVREMIAELVGYNNPDNVVFTMNATQSLNIVLRGYLGKGDHVIVSPYEHNAVIRTLNSLEVLYTQMELDEFGQLRFDTISNLIRENTKAIIVNHASNVSGEIMPINDIGAVANDNQLEFIVDAAQTLGSHKIDMSDSYISALVFTGHKSLMGPQGIGGFVITSEFSDKMIPTSTGGTGSDSISIQQPTMLPDKYESGTLNMPGIYGLHASMRFLKSIDKNHLSKIVNLFIAEVDNIKGIKVIKKSAKRSSVVSLDFIGRDNGEVSFLLEDEFKIVTRCGLHCAPLAHKNLGTYPDGTVRFSFGCFNTIDEIHQAINALKEVCK